MIRHIPAVLFELIMICGAAAFAYTALASHPNLGNITGCGLCIGAVIVCILRRPIGQFILRLRENAGGRVLIAAVCILTAAAVIVSAVILVLIAKHADMPPDRPTTVIVLGCGMKNGGPSQMMYQRCNAAYKYMTEEPSVICIVSGGQGDDEPISEAEMMAGILIDKGIDPSRIIPEDKSVSTYTNLKNSLAIMDRLGLPHEAVIITSEYHQLRTSMLAKRVGIQTWSISSRTMTLYLPPCLIREIYGVIYTFFGGN